MLRIFASTSSLIFSTLYFFTEERWSCLLNKKHKDTHYNVPDKNDINWTSPSPETNYQQSAKLKQVHKALESLHRQYDPILKLLRVAYAPHSFLTQIKGFPLHPTRESIEYALALLDVGQVEMRSRAIAIVEQVVNLQIKRKSDPISYVWPKYWEEKAFNFFRIDRNWVNFICTCLIEAVLFYQEIIPDELLSKVDNAILNSARTIQNWKTCLEYTNIVISNIYITLVAGERYGDRSLFEHGFSLLREFHTHTFHQTDFSEYNSPNYQILTLKTLGRLRRDVTFSAPKQFIEELYYLAWQGIAEHFHPPTHQWAGPHARSYSPLLQPRLLDAIERSTSDRVQFGISDAYPSLREGRLTFPCPPELEHFFVELYEPRTIAKTLKGNKKPQVFTTYLAPKFTLGTSSYSDFWHQRYPLVAYWGTCERPDYLRMRLLVNGKDLASAQFFSVQQQGTALIGVNFVSGMDRENPYTEKNESRSNRLPIKDLRLRFEFGGSSDFDRWELPDVFTSAIVLKTVDLYIRIQILYAKFGDRNISWQASRENQKLNLDLVISSNKKKSFLFSPLEQAVIGLTLEIGDRDPRDEMEYSLPEGTAICIGDELKMSWQEMSLEILNKPADQVFHAKYHRQKMGAMQ